METVTYHCGEVVVDPANRRFTRRNTEVALEPKVFAVIAQLLSRADDLMTRDELLDAVWGHRYVTPSTLNRAIALARKAFSENHEGAGYIQTVHGAGYRYIGPFERRGAATPEPRARFAPPPMARVPARLDRLIGREGEIAQIAVFFRDQRAVTLQGAGGMGKTRCALEYARRSTADYPDGVWFFDLAPMQRAQEWLDRLAVVLAISAQNEPQLIAKVTSLLAGRKALLLLDNCDRISTAIGALVVDLLRQTDHLQILATSQQPLNFVGERVMRIPPLNLPAAHLAPTPDGLRSIAASSAVELLLSRIQAVQPAFELTAGNSTQLVEICRRLDGMPLALELAATRFALLSPDQVLERLEHRFRFLVDDVAGRDRRHQTLLALIDWSYSLLSSDEQRLLCWLGVFVQGWSVTLIRPMSAAMKIDEGRLIDLLSGLVKKSLVVADASGAAPRYRLLESVRSFALEQLALPSEISAARDAQLACVLDLAQRSDVDMRSPRMRDCTAQLNLEHGNIEAALVWAQRNGDCESALEIAGSLLVYVRAHGNYATGCVWFDLALSTGEGSRSRWRARTLLARGMANLHMKAASADLSDWLSEAWELTQEAGDRWSHGVACGYRALELVNLGRAAEAAPFVATTQALAETLQDDWLRSLAGFAQGWVLIDRGEFPLAAAELEAVSRLGHDLYQRHFAETYLALALYALGELPRAAKRFRDSLLNAAPVGNVRGMAGSIEGCAYIAVELGQHAAGLRWLTVAEAIRTRTQISLFRFWIPYHDAAVAKIRSTLTPAEFSRIAALGAALRHEDAANEVLESLVAYSEAVDV